MSKTSRLLTDSEAVCDIELYVQLMAIGYPVNSHRIPG